MSEMPGSTEADVSPSEVQHALRSVRASTFRIDEGNRGTELALVMNVSTNGRRNAAGKIVGLLAEHGLALAEGEPVEALTRSFEPLLVVRT